MNCVCARVFFSKLDTFNAVFAFVHKSHFIPPFNFECRPHSIEKFNCFTQFHISVLQFNFCGYVPKCNFNQFNLHAQLSTKQRENQREKNRKNMIECDKNQAERINNEFRKKKKKKEKKQIS